MSRTLLVVVAAPQPRQRRRSGASSEPARSADDSRSRCRARRVGGQSVGGATKADRDPGSAWHRQDHLTVAALHQPTVAARYGIRLVFVRCEGSASAVATVAELAAVLGIALAAGDVRAACLRYLAEAPAVVCLDNAETAWEADTLRTEHLFAQLVHVAGLVVSLRGTERPGGLGWAPLLRPEPLLGSYAPQQVDPPIDVKDGLGRTWDC